MTQYPARLLERVTPPESEPLTLAETKLFLRVDGTEDDNLITDMISVVRESAEEYLRASLITQSWKLAFDSAAPEKVALPMGPVISLTTVKLITKSGNETVMDSSLYYLGASGTELFFDQSAIAHRVEITYSAGFGASTDIPQPIRQGMLLHAANLYSQRDLSGVIPLPALDLYSPYRRISL